MNKAQDNLRPNSTEAAVDFIFIETENRLEKTTLTDIIYIEGMRDYRHIHTIDKKNMTLQNFKKLEQFIPSSLVCRVHEFYMLALHKIDSIERSRIRIADQIIPISDTYKAAFFQKVGN